MQYPPPPPVPSDVAAYPLEELAGAQHECDKATPGGQRFFGWLRPSPAVDLAHVPVGPATTSVEGVVAVPSDRVVGLRA